MLKVSTFYLKKQNSFIPKKIKNKLAFINIKTKKSLFTEPISEGFVY
jgi:hypothetical protein